MMSDKIPLVLLPGFLDTEALWRHQVENLADIADITIGDLTPQESIAEMAASTLAQAPERFALAGLSMGGYTAFEIMLREPERVTRLALLDTTPFADPPERLEGRKNQLSMVRDGRFDEVVSAMVAFKMKPEGPPKPALADAIREMCVTAGPEVLLRQQAAMLNRADTSDVLAHIKCPTLVICGRQDVPTPPEVHEEIASRIEGAKLVIIDDCGHLASLEQPVATTEAMREWLLR
jgi:pimeloyl-ACP methyl ester carboxylesterase